MFLFKISFPLSKHPPKCSRNTNKKKQTGDLEVLSRLLSAVELGEQIFQLHFLLAFFSLDLLVIRLQLVMFELELLMVTGE